MRIIYFFLFIVLCCSCTAPQRSAAGVQNAMKEYDRLIQKMDADSIALLYAPDGELGIIAKGRDSIKQFLGSFKNVQVLSQESMQDSLHFSKDSSYQTGTYRQVVVLPSNDTLTVKGRYFAHWIWLPKTGWHIQRMNTTALN